MKKILKKLLIIAAVLMIPVLLYGGYNQENVGGGIVGPYNANDCEKVNAQGQTVSAGGACGTSAMVYPGGNGIMTVSGGNSYGSVLPYTAFGASIFDAANAPDALTILGAVPLSSVRTDVTGTNNDFLVRVNAAGNVDKTTIGTGITFSGGTLSVTTNTYDPYGAAANITNISGNAANATQLGGQTPSANFLTLITETFSQIAAAIGAFINGGLHPTSGNPMMAGTGSNISAANWTLQGTANTTYNLDTMGGGNTTVSAAIGGNVTGGTPGYLLTVGTNSVLAQNPLGSNVLAALGIAANASGGFQGTLISGTNIKTVSGHALLGSGDVALNVNDVANSLAFSGSPTTGHLAQIGAANTIVDGGTGSNLSVAYAVNAGTAAAANSVAGGNVSGNVAGANAVAVGGITGLGTGVATALAAATNTIGAFVVNIASGVANIPTSVIGTNTTVTLTAANASIVAGDVCDWGFGGNYAANAGFIPGAQLSIMSYCGAGNCDWDITNNTGANITPAANMTITWKVRR